MQHAAMSALREGASADAVGRSALPAVSASGEPRSAVRRGLAGLVFARLTINGAIRVFYPFLPVVALGLGVSFELLAGLVAARSLAGLAGPAIARVIAPSRHRALMLSGQLLAVAGCLLVAASPAAPAPLRIAVVGTGLLATGLARPLFDLPMQTWISARIPATSRGRALGLTEMTWALSLALTVPVAGVLIERVGWQSPFVLVAGLAGAGVLVVGCTIPSAGAGDDVVTPVATGRPLRLRSWPLPPGMAVCVGTGLAVAGGESLFVVYGQWMTKDLGLSVAQIGASTLLVVAAELLGAGLVVAVSDRVGLRRTMCAALLVSATVYTALGAIGQHAFLAFLAIGAVFAAFEATLAAAVALTSTVARCSQQRARVFGTLMAAIACGNVAGAVMAPATFALGGIVLSGTVSAGAAVLALISLLVGSRSTPRSQNRPD